MWIKYIFKQMLNNQFFLVYLISFSNFWCQNIEIRLLFKNRPQDIPARPWLRLHAPTVRGTSWLQVEEQRSLMPHGAAKKIDHRLYNLVTNASFNRYFVDFLGFLQMCLFHLWVFLSNTYAFFFFFWVIVLPGSFWKLLNRNEERRHFCLSFALREIIPLSHH